MKEMVAKGNNGQDTGTGNYTPVSYTTSYDDIDPRVRPLKALWDDALNTYEQYNNDDLHNFLTGEWQTSYQMNNNELYPDAPAVKDDILKTSVERRKILEHKIKELKTKFYNDETITSFAPVRLLVWWNKNLSDEITYLKYHGAVYDDPDVKPRKESTAPKRAQSPFTKKELTDPDAAKESIAEAARWHGIEKWASWNPYTEIDDVVARTTKTGTERPEAFETILTRAFTEGDLIHDVLGIDLETTGASPYRNWVVNAGWMSCDPNDTEHEEMRDRQTRYYGMPVTAEQNGLPSYVKNGCDMSRMKGKTILELDNNAQAELLEHLTRTPFVAHNARFEDSMFEMTVKGYAEAKKNGNVKIIDTLRLSRSFDPYEGKISNTLEDWAHHWNTLPDDEGEHHIGQDDTLIMLTAMIRNYAAVRCE